MAQDIVWEKEYKNPKFVTGHDKPQAFFLRFLKGLKKGKTPRSLAPGSLEGAKVLDLGSGTGRNANYLAQKGAVVSGLEISGTAIDLARKRAKCEGVEVDYIRKSIGEKYNFENNYFDLIIDITSSNSLNEKERQIYLSEVARVLKKTSNQSDGGIFFVRALCKDGDKNTKFLLKNNPGKENDTYIMPETGLVEKVFSEEGLINTYSKYFNILKIEKTESYSIINNRQFKRKFWLAIMNKK